MNTRYSFEKRGTDRQTESISECTLKDFTNDILHAFLKLKISWRRGNQYTSPFRLGGGIINLVEIQLGS